MLDPPSISVADAHPYDAADHPAIANHLPRLLARLDALDREPVISLARSLDVVTVVVGIVTAISLDTAATSLALSADT